MSTTQIRTARLHGLEMVTIENDTVAVAILPEAGGKIWSIVSRSHEADVLWHHPTSRPAVHPPGTPFDDVWSGGWDEVLPNDAPEQLGEIFLPDHGVIWTAPVRLDMIDHAHGGRALHLAPTDSVQPFHLERTLWLGPDIGQITIEYMLANTSDESRAVQWKLHPALPVRPGMMLHLPDSMIWMDEEIADGCDAAPSRWPCVTDNDGRVTDLQRLPDPGSDALRFFHAKELAGGWCGVTWPDIGLTLRCDFDMDLFRTISVFATWGGWRGLDVLVLEPATAAGTSLHAIRERGDALILAAGERLETVVTMTIGGGDPVTG